MRPGGGCAGSGVRQRYDLDAGSPANTPPTVNGSAEGDLAAG